jgi:predicted phage tail protein
MQRSVYLQGELAEKFGSKFTVHTDNYGEIFKCINANRPTFLPFVKECHRNDVGFIVDTADKSIEEQDLFLPIMKGDITISLAPAGSKSGIGKILAAIAIVVIMVYSGGAAGAFGSSAAAGTGSGWAVTVVNGVTVLSAPGMAAGMLAVNLAMMGMQQIMAPDPAVDRDSPTNYLFSGGANNAIEGDPIPLLYGELRVPGRPISIDIMNGNSYNNNTTIDYEGNIYGSGTEETYWTDNLSRESDSQ